MQIPSIGSDWIVVAGTGRSELKRGPGHYPATPAPGQLGNSAIAGHRTTYGQPFADIDRLEIGDELVVTTVTGTYVYLVDGTRIVEPTASDVIMTTDETVARLTLTSCNPRYSASQRIVVTALLDLDRSHPPIALPPVNRRAVLDADAARVSAPRSKLAGRPARDASLSPRPAQEPTTGSPPDAFGAGWLEDRGALVDVAAWGGLLVSIAIAGRRLSGRYRHGWIGPSLTAVPFVVVLYFVFQNVSRLLPAAF